MANDPVDPDTDDSSALSPLAPRLANAADSELTPDDLRVMGVVAAASVRWSPTPPALRDRVLATARATTFAFIGSNEGIWLPADDPAAPVAWKELFHDSADRVATRLLRLRAGAMIPESPLAGARAVYVIGGRLSAANAQLDVGDFVEGPGPASQWTATSDALVLEWTQGLTAGETLRRERDAPWVVPFAGTRLRVLFGAPGAAGGSRAIFVLEMAPDSTLEEHEHDGIEELYVLRGSCEVEGHRMSLGDYHRAASGSTHQVTRTRAEGCVLVVAVRDPTRLAA